MGGYCSLHLFAAQVLEAVYEMVLPGSNVSQSEVITQVTRQYLEIKWTISHFRLRSNSTKWTRIGTGLLPSRNS